MVYTRSSVTAAQSLVSMRSTNLTVTRYHSNPSVLKGKATVTTARTRSGPTNAQIWREWTNWWQPFVMEVRDEGIPHNLRSIEVMRRWLSFTAKQLKCSEDILTDWFDNADAEKLKNAVN